MMKHYFKFLTWLGLLFMLGIYYPVDLAAQTGKTVQGIVRDSNTAEGIPGVNVIEKGTTNGTVTDLDGSFRLTVNSDNSTLEFSFIGYTKKELLVGNQTQLNVNLEENMSELGEVVVVGFGNKAREDITGSVSSVKMDKILGDRPVTDAARALQGTVPGLQVTFGTGQPGQSTRLNIRGFESINGGSPLVLVDNIPMNIDDINPRDIEEVTVLKDASAASIYGAEAAFGVILITTKKGEKNQPMRLEYSNNFAFTSPSTLPRKASPLEFATALRDWGQQSYWTGQNVDNWIGYIQEYNANPSAYPDGYITDPNGSRYYVRENDLYGEFLGAPGFEHIHNLSLSGGSDKNTYRVSFGFNDEDGIMVTNKDRFTRYNANIHMTSQVTSKLNMTFNTMYKNGLRTGPVGGNWQALYNSAINFHSAVPIGYDETASGDRIPFATPANIIRYSPVRENYEEVIRFFTKASLTPFAGMELNAEYTFERRNDAVVSPSFRPTFVAPTTLNLEPYQASQSSFTTNTAKRNYHAVNAYGKYDWSLGKSKVNLMLGMNQQVAVSEGFSASRQELISPDIPGLSTATGVINVSDFYTDYGIVGFFGRANYHFDDKYLLEVNGRYDGSSRFPPGSRFGFFPSVAGAWKVHREQFMQDIGHVMTNLKLRASWGEIGNQAVESTWGNYPYLPIMSSGNTAWISDDTGQRAVTLSTPALVSAAYTWERVRTLNFGIDLGLFDNRLYTTFDWYNRQTLDMLAGGAQLPNVLGATPPLQNVADLQTIGWELDMRWRDNLGKLNYSFGFNLYDNMTEVTRFNNEEGLINQFYVGQKINEIWGYVTDGFYTIDDFVPGSLNNNLTGGQLLDGIPAFRGRDPNPGDVRYADLNGDGEIFSGLGTLDDPGDRKIIGNSTRRFEFGFNGAMNYKNFDVSFLVRGIGKRDLWIGHDVFFPFITQFGTIFQHQLDYWTQENPEAFYPRVYPEGGGNYPNSRLVQTRYLSNGAFLRVQNITVGYTFNQALLSRLNINRMRVFVSGENLFSFDHLPDGLDPELQGVNRGGNYPFLRKASLGLNVTF